MRSAKLLALVPILALILQACAGPSATPTPRPASPTAAAPAATTAAPATAVTPTAAAASPTPAVTTAPTAAATVAPTPTAAITPAPAPRPAAPGLFGFGRSASQDVIARWDIDIAPNGAGLPPGSGTADQGATVYRQVCAACHGQTGKEGGIGPVLISGPGPYKVGMPRTIGSYWPYATTLFDYIRRAMPFDRPGSLTPDQVYAVVAYLLRENGVITGNQEMNAKTLPEVRMPNRDNFISCWPAEQRPQRASQDCRPDVP